MAEEYVTKDYFNARMKPIEDMLNRVGSQLQQLVDQRAGEAFEAGESQQKVKTLEADVTDLKGRIDKAEGRMDKAEDRKLAWVGSLGIAVLAALFGFYLNRGK